MKKLAFKYVYHSHTERCGHASGKDEEFVKSAIKQGVQILCFTDHTPIPNFSQPNIRMECSKLDEYVSSINFLKEKYKEKIEIHVGLEVENAIFDNNYLKEYITSKGIEFVIIGQHMIQINNEWTWLSNEEFSLRERINAYVNSITSALDSGLSKYVAHPDIFIFAVNQYNEEIEQGLRKIVECAIRNNAFIEMNVHGVYNSKDKIFKYPYVDFWKMVKRDYPTVKITIGMDIHHLDEYSNNTGLPEVMKIIKEIGIKPISRIDIERELK